MKELKNIEKVRDQLKELKKQGMSYKNIAAQTNVGYGVLRNFVSGYRDSMSEINWQRITQFLEEGK